MTGIEFEEGKSGLREVLKSAWSDQIASEIQNRCYPEFGNQPLES